MICHQQIVEYLLKEFRELEDIPNEAEGYPIHFASASGEHYYNYCVMYKLLWLQ